jgi:hypothetical protein
MCPTREIKKQASIDIVSTLIGHETKSREMSERSLALLPIEPGGGATSPEPLTQSSEGDEDFPVGSLYLM